MGVGLVYMVPKGAGSSKKTRTLLPSGNAGGGSLRLIRRRREMLSARLSNVVAFECTFGVYPNSKFTSQVFRVPRILAATVHLSSFHANFFWHTFPVILEAWIYLDVAITLFWQEKLQGAGVADIPAPDIAFLGVEFILYRDVPTTGHAYILSLQCLHPLLLDHLESELDL